MSIELKYYYHGNHGSQHTGCGYKGLCKFLVLLHHLGLYRSPCSLQFIFYTSCSRGHRSNAEPGISFCYNRLLEIGACAGSSRPPRSPSARHEHIDCLLQPKRSDCLFSAGINDTYKVATALDTRDMQNISLNLTRERVSRSAVVVKIGGPLQHDVSVHRSAFTGQPETGTLSPFYILNQSSRKPDHTPMIGMRSEQYL